MKALAFHDVSTDYIAKGRQVLALNNLSLEVEEGSFAVILGPSGCGKTTLLKTVLGQKDYEGDILLYGQDIEKTAIKDRGIASISQEHVLYPSMTVFDNLAFALKVAGNSYAVVEERVLAVAKQLNLEPLLTRKPRQISGGQQQKVCLAKALLSRARLYLFDEPFSDLDEASGETLRSELLRLKKGINATFLFVTHDQKEAFELADRIFLLKDGALVQEGKPLELLNTPKDAFVISFLSPLEGA